MLIKVVFSKTAEKQVLRVPAWIYSKLAEWISEVDELGLEEVRKSRGYHDEPLKGDRMGARSIRLNRSYRAIYGVRMSFIIIEEVTKHVY